jgi:hypothetical protein
MLRFRPLLLAQDRLDPEDSPETVHLQKVRARGSIAETGASRGHNLMALNLCTRV